MAGADQHQLREYLLGQLTEADEEEVELRLLTEPDLADEYDIAVNEIIDDYLAGRFEGEELDQVERYFFKSDKRRQKLKFALALKERQRRGNSHYRRSLPYLRIAASVLVVVGIAVGVWRVYFYQDNLTKGQLALRAAFKKERPIEARLVDFGYAPLPNTRGGQVEVDKVQHDLASSLLLQEVSQHPSAAAHHALGQYYLAERKVDQAIDQFNQALALAPNNAKIYSDLGAALLEQGRIQASSEVKGKEYETFARSLVQLNKALELDGTLLEAYFNRALAYQYMLLRAQAEPAWRDYLQRDSNSLWADEARRYLTLLENGRKTSHTAADALTSFLAAFRAGDDEAAWKILTSQYTSAGNGVTNKLLDSLLDLDGNSSSGSEPTLQVLSYIGRLEFSNAGDRYTSDLAKVYENGLPTKRAAMTDARRHVDAGYGLFLKSSYKRAIAEYEAARLIYEQTGNEVERAFVDYRLAHCYIFLPDFDKASSTFKRLAASSETKGYLWILGQTFFGLAHVSADSREYSKAIDYSGRALAVFERQGDVNGILKSLTQLADVNQWLNRVSRSLSYLSRGLALGVERQASPTQQWSLLTQMALNMRSMQLHTAELLYHKEALRLALEMKVPLLLSRSHGYTGAAYSELGMYDEAVNEVTSAYEIGQGIQDNQGSEIMAKSRLQLGDVLRQTNECDRAMKAYDESISLYGSLKTNYYDYAAHKGKLLCLVRNSDDQTVREELHRVLALSNVYRSNITNQSQRDSFFDMEQGVYDQAISFEFTRAKDYLRAFEYSEESRARSLLDAVQGGAAVQQNVYGLDLKLPGVTKNMSLEEIQRKMPGNAQILQYSVLDDRLLIWVVTPSGIQHEEVPIGSKALTLKVRDYLATMNHPPAASDGEARDQGRELYKILITPVEGFLDQSKLLCIIPDKVLHYLSYDALFSPTTDKYLIESYDTVVAASSTTFTELSALAERKAGAFEESLLSVGNPSFKSEEFDSLIDLPAAANEATAVAEFYPKQQVLLREEAQETRIKSALRQADVVHLAMHYILNEQSEMLSGFPLAPEYASESDGNNGFLQFHEIYAMKLPRTRLVILSACQTGIEQNYDGEGAVSVARPFLVKGVPVVVASLWPVDSNASAELMTNFHRHRIRDRVPVARALKQAKIEMIRGKVNQHRHPYYWAPFVPIGGATPY